MKNYLKHFTKLLAAFAIIANPLLGYEYDDNHHQDSNHAIPPPQNHPGEDSLTFSVGAMYTLWVPYQEMPPVFTQATPDNSIGKVVYPYREAKSGFKVNASMNLHHDGWVVGAIYTWFSNNNKLRNPSDSFNPQYFTTIFTDPDTVTTDADTDIDLAFGNWFNRIDVFLDRSFYAGHYLAFRPWVGIQAAWDYQDLESNFVVGGLSLKNSHKQKWWGCGPEVGTEAAFYIMDELCIFMSGCGALLYGNNYSAAVVENNITNIRDYQNMSSIYNVEAMMDTSLGAKWMSVWTNWAMSISVAWEMQTYFAHMLYFDDGERGAYSMQGLTVGLGLNF